MLEKIKAHSPKEVYFIAIIYFVVLFLNCKELFLGSWNWDYIFRVDYSIIYGLIRGIADNHIDHEHAVVFYWVILFTYSSIVLIKAKKISAWLWNR